MTNMIRTVDPSTLLSDLDNSYSQSSAMQQFRSAALPFDVALEIFKYLGQEDCLTCMAVCREWNRTIPHYTKKVWSTVKLGARDIQFRNTRQIRCLGDHVKTVVLDTVDDDKELFDLTYKLLEWGCIKIECLEFKNCVSDDQNAFVDALSKLASQLTHLTLANHESNIAYLHVLDACPNLTHFTYSAAAETEWSYINEEPDIEKKLSGTEQHTNLVYLCLDVALDPQLRLEPILRSCPNLRCFIGASSDPGRYLDDTFEDLYADTMVDPATILRWCPKLTHLQSNYSYISTANKFQYIDNDQDGLRYLSICNDIGLELSQQFLMNHRYILEHLCIQNSNSDMFEHVGSTWDELFESLELPQLRVLYCGERTSVAHSSLLSLAKRSPLLEKLVCLGTSSDTIEQPMLQSFPILSCLRILEFKYRHIDVPLMTFLNLFPALEDLSLTYAWMSLELLETCHGLSRLKRLYLKSNGNADKVTPENRARFLQHLVAHASNLETIQLISEPEDADDTMVINECLKVVADIPTLKICEIGLTDTGLSDEQEILKQFIVLLKSNTKIEQLKFGGIRQLAHDTLYELGELQFLTKFDTAPPSIPPKYPSYTHIDGTSLLQMLRKTTSLVDINLRSVGMNLAEPDFVKFIEQIKTEFPVYDVSWCPLEEEDESSGDEFLCDIVLKRR